MQITVDVAEDRVADLVRQRIAELFSDDSRFRDTGVRELLRRIVDEAATMAVRSARDAIAAELPAMAADAVKRAVKDDIEKAAKRGLGARRRSALFAYRGEVQLLGNDTVGKFDSCQASGRGASAEQLWLSRTRSATVCE